MNQKFKYLKAFLIDIFLGVYIIISADALLFERHDLEVGIQWGMVGYLTIIGLLLGSIIFFVKKLSIGRVCLKISPKMGVSLLSRPFVILSWFLLIYTFGMGIMVTEFSFFEFFSESGLGGANRIFSALIAPNFEVLDQGIISIIETIFMAFMATIFAIPFAFILSFFSARNLMNKTRKQLTIYYVIRLIQNVSRSIEPIVWAIIFSVWVGIGPFAGMLALFVHSVASLAKLYSEQIENIDDGPIEAISSTGAHPIQVIWFGVVPQVLLPFLSFTVYRWDINIRMATIIGLVGGGGIGTLLMQYQGLGRWNEVGLLIMIIAFIVWTMDFLSSKMRESIK